MTVGIDCGALSLRTEAPICGRNCPAHNRPRPERTLVPSIMCHPPSGKTGGLAPPAPPGTCRSAVGPRVTLPGLLLPWLALTVCQYIVAYHLIFWLVSFRRTLLRILGLMAANAISAGLVVAALFFVGKEFWSPVNVALAIIVTALAMALLYRLAFRRWCHLDLA